MRQIQVAARQGTRDAQRHGPAQSQFRRPHRLADPVRSDGRLERVRQRQVAVPAGTGAGFVQVSAPPKAAIYKITLSSESWIDVVQNGHAVKSSGFSGAVGCEGIRKSVKFDLAAQPFTLQLSGAPANTIRIVVSTD
jgi:hypothetical protein